MSHYTVLAIVRKDSHQKLEALLAPYNENKKVKPYVAQTKAQLIAEEIQEIEKYRRSHAAAIKLSRDEYLAIAEKENLYGNYDLMKEDLPDAYASIDLTDEAAIFARVKKTYGRELNKNGDLISTYNPNSKWDWYEIGGRWKGQLLLRNGAPTDSAPAGLVDWDALFSTAPAAAAKNAAFWDEYVLGKIPAGVEDTEKYLLGKFGPIYYRPEYFLKFYGTKEEYVRRKELWFTYAVVDDKGWHEPGKMGWWGCSGATPESKREWEDNFRSRFIDTLDPGDQVFLLDCHI